MMTSLTLMDLQNACGKIDHHVLLQKLYTSGFLKHTVNCLNFYLSNECFVLNLRNISSQPASLSHCVSRLVATIVFDIYQ